MSRRYAEEEAATETETVVVVEKKEYHDHEPSIIRRVGEPVLAVAGLSLFFMLIIHHLRSVIPGGIFDGHHRRDRSRSRSRSHSRSRGRPRSCSPGPAYDHCAYNTIARDTFAIVLAIFIYSFWVWWCSRVDSHEVDGNHRGYTSKVGESVFIAVIFGLILIVYFRAGNSIHS